MTTRAWDYGIAWFQRVTVPPEALPDGLAFMRDLWLRVTNGEAEDEFIQRAIRSACGLYSDETQRALMPETRELILSGFPCEKIKLPAPPLIEVTSIAYYDGDGEVQALTVSPQAFVLVPSGADTGAEIWPEVDAAFPATQARPDAVTVTFRCGYEDVWDIPEQIISGVGLIVGELYKQRSLSQVGTSIVAAPLQTNRFWKRYWG